jgi:hypothetical protein
MPGDQKGANEYALAPLRTARPDHTRAGCGRPAAAFLAQLIAAKQNLPQTRERGRAEPEDAIAAYRAVAVTRLDVRPARPAPR